MLDRRRLEPVKTLPIEAADSREDERLGTDEVQLSALEHAPAFVSEDAIACIRDAGGAAVLAHPGGSLPLPTVEHLKEAGLDGIEIWHPQHGAAAVRRWREVAARLRLIECGGSDFHGTHRGAALGDMPVPERTVDLLLDAARR